MWKTNVTRRYFLRSAAQAGAVLALPAIVPATVLGKNGAVPPSEKIVVGGIGIQAIYDRLQPAAGAAAGSGRALRGAILGRGKEGIPLMVEAIRGTDYVLAAAVARAAMELPGPEVTAALAGELPKLPADKQLLVVNTLGYRGDASAGPAMLGLIRKGPMPVRLGCRSQPHAPGLCAGPDAVGRAFAHRRDRPGRRGTAVLGQLSRQGRRRRSRGHAHPQGCQGPVRGRRVDRPADLRPSGSSGPQPPTTTAKSATPPLRALCDWPTADALPLVANLIKAAQNPTIKILAIRGFVRLIPQQDPPDARKLDSLKDVMALATETRRRCLC